MFAKGDKVETSKKFNTIGIKGFVPKSGTVIKSDPHTGVVTFMTEDGDKEMLNEDWLVLSAPTTDRVREKEIPCQT